MPRVDPVDPRIAQLEEQLAEARRKIARLEAQLGKVAAPSPPIPRAGAATLELTVQSTTTEGLYRVVAQWDRPGLLPVRCERQLQLDREGLDADATAYGPRLGRALFEGNVRDLFAQARADESPLRVLLAVEARELQTLRWERLCGPFDGDRWDLLGLNQRAPFSLYLPSTTDRRFRTFGRGELRALVVVASPEPGCQLAEHFDEERAQADALAGLGEAIPARVLGKVGRAEGPPTLTEICRRLADEPYTVLHLVCHGVYNRRSGETAVLLDGDDGQTVPVPATEVVTQLGRLGSEHGLPHLGFLAVCDSAKPEAEGALGGLGQRLVREVGMPAVVAMTEHISQATAFALSREFYPRLVAHGEVDRALAEACVAVRSHSDIAVPVPALLSRLGGRPLFVDSVEGPLTEAEVRAGRARLVPLVRERAPVLLDGNGELLADGAATPEELDRICQQVLELDFAALARGATPPEYHAECPFPGLRAFTGAERRFFRGRKALVDSLVGRSGVQPLLVVLGSSGSGKSSVVMAGVIPVLEERHPGLKVAQLTPGERPLGKLEAALATLGDAPDRLLYVDQFEETFTLASDTRERKAFLDRLLAQPGPRTRVILTMRADFLGECATHPGLREAVERQPQLVPPMTPEELRAAIEEQAQEAGLRFETGLCELILQDLVSEPGAMPLLQHALHELWDRRHGRWLRLAAYDREIGRVKGAIARTADRVYDALGPDDQARVKSMMKKLTHVGDGAGAARGAARDTRRRVPLGNLCPDRADAEEQGRVRTLVARLAGEGARLLVTSHDEKTGEDLVEVAHEALIREWPNLRRWLDEGRYALQLGQQVEAAARDWRANDCRDDYLSHRGARGEVVRGLFQKGALDLDAEQQRYMEACEAEERRLQREKEEQARRLQDALLGSYEEQGRARYLGGLPDQALVYLNAAFQGGRREPSTRFLLARAMWQAVDRWGRRMEHADALASLSFSPDGARLLTTCRDSGRATVWEVATGEPLYTLEHEGVVRVAAFSPDGAQIVTGCSFEVPARLWDARDGKPLVTLKGHEGDTLAAFSPDSKRVVTAGSSAARVWDTRRGKLLCTLTGHENDVLSVAFSPDGQRVLTASTDRTARLWDARHGKLLATLTGHDGEVNADRPVNAAVFSPGGDQIVTAGGWSMRVWNAEDGTPAWGEDESTRMAHEQEVLSATFSRSGRRLVTTGLDGLTIVWDCEQMYKPVVTLRCDSQAPRSAAFSPDELCVVTTSEDGMVRVWDAAGGALVTTIDPPGGARSAVFSPDGRSIAAICGDRAVQLWSFRGNLTALSGGPDPQALHVMAAAFRSDGQQVVTGSKEGEVALWDAASGAFLQRLEADGCAVRTVAMTRDGARVLSLGDYQTAKVWDVARDEVLATLGQTTEEASLPGILCAALSPDGTRVATGSTDTKVRLWEAASGELLAELEGHVGPVYATSFSADGARVLSLDQTDHIPAAARLWDAATGQPLATLAHEAAETETVSQEVVFATFSPDGARVVTCGIDGTVRLWDGTSGAPLNTLHESAKAAAFSPDGKLLVLHGDDKTARIRRVDDGLRLTTLSGHQDVVFQAEFSADSARVLTASYDKTARVWDAARGTHLLTLPGQRDPMTVARFSPDGTRVLTASATDETALLWDLGLETRDPEAIDGLVRARVPFLLEDGLLISV